MSVFTIKLHSFSTNHEARRSLTEHETRSMFMLHEAQRASLAGKSDSELILSSPTPSSQAFTVSPPLGAPAYANPVWLLWAQQGDSAAAYSDVGSRTRVHGRGCGERCFDFGNIIAAYAESS